MVVEISQDDYKAKGKSNVEILPPISFTVKGGLAPLPLAVLDDLDNSEDPMWFGDRTKISHRLRVSTYNTVAYTH